MKKIKLFSASFLMVVIASSVLISCQKELQYSVPAGTTGGSTDTTKGGGGTDTTSSGTNTNYPAGVYFKANGVQKSYTQVQHAVFTTLVGQYAANMIGETVNGTNVEGAVINITSNSPIVQGSLYTDPIFANIEYLVSTSVQYQSTLAINPNAKIKITSLTSSTVKGTFSGTVKNVFGSDSLVITEGTFNVPKQ